ncbi:MAG TPA: hypothetical protein PK838_03525 [Thermoleophilia bacterium]|nr:hypothetical protein [Thermoleophilia bacterium]
MGIMSRNRSFLFAVVLVLVGGLAILGGVTAIRVFAEDGSTTTATTGQSDYNKAGSYGITGYQPLKLEPTSDTPKFITKALNDQKGVILLVYVRGASADEEMLANFNKVKTTYRSQASFFNFEAREVKELGDVLTQLKVNAPPMLAVVKADGSVAQLYTGWIGQKVMEQVVANALRAQ